MILLIAVVATTLSMADVVGIFLLLVLATTQFLGTLADIILAGSGNDTLYGDAGNDTLSRGGGNDILNGGSRSNLFDLEREEGTDIVQDFKDGSDRFGLADGLTFGQLSINQSNSDTLIRLSTTNLVLASLRGVNSNLIEAEDFTVISGSP